jgi:hypothetical protein
MHGQASLCPTDVAVIKTRTAPWLSLMHVLFGQARAVGGCHARWETRSTHRGHVDVRIQWPVLPLCHVRRPRCDCSPVSPVHCLGRAACCTKGQSDLKVLPSCRSGSCGSRVLVSFGHWIHSPFAGEYVRPHQRPTNRERACPRHRRSASAAHARNMWPSIIMWTGHAEQRVLDCGGAAVEVEVTTPTSPTRRSGDCSSDVIVARTTRAPQRRESGTPATVSPLRTQRSGATQPSVVRTLRWAVSVSALVLLHVASGELPTMVHVCARDRAVYLASPHSPLYHSADVLSA